MTPYYSDAAVTIYHGDCRELGPWPPVDLVLTDPPYGVAERTDRESKGRGGPARWRPDGTRSRVVAPANDFPPVHGDGESFDPTWMLEAFPRLILWGANHYAHLLPASPSWIVWDKLAGLESRKRQIGVDDNADIELATPDEADNGCELGIAYDPVGGWPA